jgi:hypothetical protein
MSFLFKWEKLGKEICTCGAKAVVKKSCESGDLDAHPLGPFRVSHTITQFKEH